MGEAPERGEITSLLQAHRKGDGEAYDRLVPLVYEHLRRLARQQLRHGRPGQTLDTVALAHEAYLQLVEERGVDWKNRAHFYGVTSRAMRRIIVDYARRRSAKKRGGDRVAIELDPDQLGVEQHAELVVAVGDALTQLAQLDERLVRVVECRFFAGMTEQEIAEALGISVRTVQREWLRARAWLKRSLE